MREVTGYRRLARTLGVLRARACALFLRSCFFLSYLLRGNLQAPTIWFTKLPAHSHCHACVACPLKCWRHDRHCRLVAVFWKSGELATSARPCPHDKNVLAVGVLRATSIDRFHMARGTGIAVPRAMWSLSKA